MLTLFSGRHIGAPQRRTNMAFQYWAQSISAKGLDKYLLSGKTRKPITSSFLDFILTIYWMVYVTFFCVTVKAICGNYFMCRIKKFEIRSLHRHVFWIILNQLTHFIAALASHRTLNVPWELRCMQRANMVGWLSVIRHASDPSRHISQKDIVTPQ